MTPRRDQDSQSATKTSKQPQNVAKRREGLEGMSEEERWRGEGREGEGKEGREGEEEKDGSHQPTWGMAAETFIF
ncbi:hypothetical protein ACE6H2_021098 [Prunus campanulata]